MGREQTSFLTRLVQNLTLHNDCNLIPSALKKNFSAATGLEPTQLWDGNRALRCASNATTTLSFRELYHMLSSRRQEDSMAKWTTPTPLPRSDRVKGSKRVKSVF